MITPCVWVSLSNSDVLRRIVLQQIATDAVNNGQQLQLTFPLVQGNRIDINVQGQHSVASAANDDSLLVIAIIFSPFRKAFLAISTKEAVSPDLLISTSVPRETRVS